MVGELNTFLAKTLNFYICDDNILLLLTILILKSNHANDVYML